MLAAGCGGGATHPWQQPNGDLASTRAVPSAIDRTHARRLRPEWHFRLPGPGTSGGSGVVAATPVADAGSVYIEDLQSNVYALNATTGELQWEHRFDSGNPGPNGLAATDGLVFGATDTTAFALAEHTGRLVWSNRILASDESFVDIAPLVARSRVFVATTGYSFGTRGRLYALDEKTGAIDWRAETIKRPWRHPNAAGGGGAWYPPSIAADGTLYWGTANPIPWGGTRRWPNGAAFPGPVRYTDSLMAVDSRSGRLLWHDQVTPHDVRDYDFELSPILARDMVIGAGKAGRVVAWSARSRKRIWTTVVGVHRNDLGPLPARRVRVCPGLSGGVETPMAESDDVLFVPVVDLCFEGSATGYQSLASVDPLEGRGELVALSTRTGHQVWVRRFPAPDLGCATAGNGVVFTSTLDGSIYGLDARTGAVVWSAHMPAGINACPALVGRELVVAAGVPLPGRRRFEVEAFAAK
jgi:outer membrane protein assembly factor BamB